MSGENIISTFQSLLETSRYLRSSIDKKLSDKELDYISTISREIESNIAWTLGKGFGIATIEEEIQSAEKFVPDPDVIFDVGAHFGSWSEAALKKFPHARVFAYEPQTASSAKLSELVVDFGGRLTVVECALSDHSGRVKIFGDGNGSGLSSLHKRDLRHYNIPFEELYEVEARTIASEVARLRIGTIDILKIDVEGHELSVLKSAGNFLHKVKYIQFEFGGTAIDARTYLRDFMHLLDAYGFRLMRIAPIGLVSIEGYAEALESFDICNFAAINRGLMP